MKITLINPLSGYFRYDAMSMPPMGLLYIASNLREAGHAVTLLDRNVIFYGDLAHIGDHDRRLDELDRISARQLASYAPAMVGITIMTCQLKDAARSAKLARKTMGCDGVIVAGGYHPTLAPEHTLTALGEVDFAVRGQGEWAMRDLANGVAPERIDGLSWREQRQTTMTERLAFWRSKPATLLSSPDRAFDKTSIFTHHPDRDLIDQSFYCKSGASVLSYYWFRKPMSAVTSQGCPKRCNFCASRLMEERLYFHPVGAVVEEVTQMIDQYDISGILFYDINFPVYKKRTKELMEAFIAEGISERIKWIASASADDLPYDLLPLMRKAGCVGLTFGLESASQNVLNLLNKKTRAEKNQEAVTACIENDIRPQSGFIVGVPGETEKDIDISLEFIAKNDLMSSLNVLLPLPATDINRQLVEAGRLDPNHPDYYGLISDTNAPLTPARVFNDMPFDRFVEKINRATEEVCAPTWKTIYVDQPDEAVVAPAAGGGA